MDLKRNKVEYPFHLCIGDYVLTDFAGMIQSEGFITEILDLTNDIKLDKVLVKDRHKYWFWLNDGCCLDGSQILIKYLCKKMRKNYELGINLRSGKRIK